jgi:microcystin-dependent protein
VAGESKSTILIAIISAISAVVVAVITTYGTIAVSAPRAREVKKELEETSRRPDFLVIRPGTILSFGGLAELDDPKGYIPCDGRQVKRDDYPDLFAAIGTAWGQGDGSTTFNVPDLRGYFLRGTDAGARRDPDVADRTAIGEERGMGGNIGDNVGSVQSDEFGKHTHDGEGNHQHYWKGYNNVKWGKEKEVRSRTQYWDSKDPEDAITRLDGAHNHGPQGGNETRPKNAYVNFIIKY